MKLLIKQTIIAIALTLAYVLYVDFRILAHWVIVLFMAIMFLFWLTSFIYNRKAFFQTIYLAELTFYFVAEMFKATFLVVREVLSRKSRIEEGIIALPLDVKSNLEITILASLISLTPGTLSLELSEDKSLLFIHAMYIPGGDVEKIKAQIKNGFERRVIRAFR